MSQELIKLFMELECIFDLVYFLAFENWLTYGS